MGFTHVEFAKVRGPWALLGGERRGRESRGLMQASHGSVPKPQLSSHAGSR